ncbi:hypothetical protein C8Q72DRAFT_323523 [Fomitopsis betulina]|nr:hypothetical protein C8Q72DRAFT_323523 [Fomitopsis betulina]
MHCQRRNVYSVRTRRIRNRIVFKPQNSVALFVSIIVARPLAAYFLVARCRCSASASVLYVYIIAYSFLLSCLWARLWTMCLCVLSLSLSAATV